MALTSALRSVATWVARRLIMVLMPRAAVTMTAAGTGIGYQSSVHQMQTENVSEVQSVESIEVLDISGKLAKHSTKTYPRRNVNRVTGRVFHHSATTNQNLSTIAQYHVVSRGWPGIAYHIAIGWDGKIYLLNDFSIAFYHTAGHNARNIGIVLVGNYEQNRPSEAMVHSIERLREHLDAQGITIEYIHMDLVSTACPGRYAIEALRPQKPS